MFSSKMSTPSSDKSSSTALLSGDELPLSENGSQGATNSEAKSTPKHDVDPPKYTVKDVEGTWNIEHIVQELKMEFEDLRDDLENRIEDLESEVQELRDQVDEQEAGLSDLRVTIDDQERELSDLRAKVEDLELELEDDDLSLSDSLSDSLSLSL